MAPDSWPACGHLRVVEPLLVGDTVNKTLICATWYSRASKPGILVLGPSPVDNENMGDVPVLPFPGRFVIAL